MNREIIEKIIIIIIGVVIAVLMVGFFKKYYNKIEPGLTPTPTSIVTPKEEPQTLGGEISEQIENPTEKLPQVNPYEAKTNPFEETKTNPFENLYKNPFQ